VDVHRVSLLQRAVDAVEDRRHFRCRLLDIAGSCI
jgi:hypothetical protein